MNSLSILIPVYNWDCTRFLTDLHTQAVELGVPCEILVADDCSTIRYDNDKAPGCRYIGLEKNIGRAAIRNLLAGQAQYDKLLFMDCDARVRTDTFLKDYLEASAKADVVCGGAIHPDFMPAGAELRYRYEKKADEKRGAAFRSKEPYARFTPFSFLISRDVFMSIKFDETFHEYGYEDVLFGLELERRNISILHIDNQLEHIGLEDNETFLNKTEQAVRSAWEHRDNLKNGSTLLNHYSRFAKCGMRWIPRLAWKLFSKPMRRNLVGNNPSLKVFSMYKLCYLCSINK